MDNKETQESGMTVGDFFRIVFSQKWLALAILIVVTLAGTVGIYFGKNSTSTTYDVSFTLELPQTEIKEEVPTSATVVYYPDGTPFYYSDIVSLTTLRKVKKANEAFEDINIEKMSKSGDISISRTINETANNSGAYESIYNLSVKASYFPNKDVARDFVVALTNTPIDELSLMDIEYNVYINSAKVAPDYVTEISQLIAQTNYLISRYETFIEIYNDLSVDGKTLRSYAQEIKSYLSDSGELEMLLADARKNGYLKTESLKDKYETELYMLERQYKIASETLKNLLTIKEGSDSLSVSSAAIIKEQSDLVAELSEKIREIKEIYQKSEYYGDKVPKEFIDGLAEQYKRVEDYTSEFKNIVSKLYSKVSVVSYSNSNVIVKGGSMGLILSLVISFIIGLVVSIILSFLVGWVKNKKVAKAAVAANAVNAETPEENAENAEPAPERENE